MEGFIYPNEAIIQWDLLIVIYPYITGLVAGAFIVSSLYHLFGIKALKPVARFSLITALAFAMVAPMPLLVHAGRPERGLEMLLTPNVTSAMSMFGFILLFYILLLIGEVWLIFRKDIVAYHAKANGIKKTIYAALALGVFDVSEKSLKTDAKIIKILAAVGVPSAAFLHGYVGAIFGLIKANPWWSTPLMPIIFLMSAIVSGIALLIVLYALVSFIRKVPVDHDCLKSLFNWLGGFLVVALTLEALEVISMLYMAEESWESVSRLMTDTLGFSYFGVQFGLGALIPLLLLAVIGASTLSPQAKSRLGIMAAVFVMIGVFAMRWNVVIGGQLLSKSLSGFGTYVPPLLGKEGLLTAGAIMALPFVIFAVITYFLPPWPEKVEVATEHRWVGLRGR